MKRAVVTGCTGCIGTSLINELLQDGYDVTAVVRESSKRISNLASLTGVNIVLCNLDNIGSLPHLLNKSYDVFYHLAWDGTFGQSRNDLKTQCNNVKFALDAVAAAKKLGCKRFIGVGSQAEYGRVNETLTPETSCNPENGYGIAKLAAGLMTRIECNKNNLEHIWVRVLSVYGPNDGEGTMISSGISSMLNGGIPEFTNGEQLWDYLYCDDAANALRLIFEHGKNNAVYCLGSGTADRLSNYIVKMRDAVRKAGFPGAEVKLGAVPYSENQVMHLCADISALVNDTGFAPATPFEDGIFKTVNSIKEKGSKNV